MSAIATLAVRTPGQKAEQFAAHLEKKLGRILCQLEREEVYQVMAHPETDRRLVIAVLKHYLLEVFSFVPHVTEATFTAIGRLPKNRPDLMKPMILHDLEEVDHGEMALRDYVRLGGNEKWARSRRMTPASFAVAATCRMLAVHESPFAYLGYMYFFEALTPLLAERVLKFMAAKDFPKDAQGFIDFHAKEDIGHARRLHNLIVRVIRDFPEAAAAIEYGLDCFSGVYPVPIWKAAFRHAQEELC
ncbi:MAG TPA: iron-containing redox enzyme family protein [Gemmataceae bacterium]|nr:iron-containing redox enzyme family protein [Gemmataceae bacterium]